MPQSITIVPLLESTPAPDAYARLLAESRGLRRPQQVERAAWVSTLSSDRRELLFELETLLKATACFANSRNHPGRPRRVPIVAQDFRLPLAILSKGFRRIVQLARQCLGSTDRYFEFHRYLETLLPEDTHRSRLLEERRMRPTPQDNLFALRQSMTNLVEVSDGLVQRGRVPFRLFHAVASLARREVFHSVFFNPLATLEFRPEFDRIPSTQVTSIIGHLTDEHVQRLAALAFLSLFRMLRYVKLIEQYCMHPSDASGLSEGRVYLVLSVLRSDARALGNYLRRHGGRLLAQGFEVALMRHSARELCAQYEQLLTTGSHLIDIRAAFEWVGASLRLEMRRCFEHDVVSPQQEISVADLRKQVGACIVNLRPALQHTVLFLAKGLDETVTDGAVFEDHAALQQLSERFREHVWMFAQIVRAFTVKAKAAQQGTIGWDSITSLQFVREFLSYFESMGYPLVRGSDYPRFQAFVAVMDSLRDTDIVNPEALNRALSECYAFHRFLVDLVDKIGLRQELANVPFDTRRAADTLRLYLKD